jgi:hypothetical protein
MSLKDTDVRTPGDSAIAKKFKLSLAKVRKLVDVGAKHEKEHNTNLAKAKEVARDHIGERPDYYKMLAKAEKTDKNHMSEDFSGVDGVRGLGYVTGDPAVGLNDYINTNAMAYEDENGNKLGYLKQAHIDLHNNSLGYKAFNPTQIGANKNFIKEAVLNELGEFDDKGGSPIVGDLTGASRIVAKLDVKEEKPCWKGYSAKGLKKKGGKMVPNCVPGKDRSLNERGKVPADMSDGAERGIYQEGHIGFGHPYDWAGDRVKRKVYGTFKPKDKDKPSSNEPGTGDTYNNSKQGGTKVKFAKTVKEDWSPEAIKKVKTIFTHKKGREYGYVTDHGDGKFGTRRKVGMFWRTKIHNSKEAAMAHLQKEHVETINELKAETLGSYIKKAAESRKKSLSSSKPDIKSWSKRQKGISTAVKKLTHVDEQTPSHLHLNKPDTKYAPGAAGITHTIHEETKMDNKELINEALGNILEENLSGMKENLMLALQEKAMEKLEERKKEIAAQYFAQ